jgi:seryl-tRNA synthetase
MSEIEYRLHRPWRDDQMQFISSALQSSFGVSDVRVTDGMLRISHDHDGEAEAIQRMVKRFLFIVKSLHTDTVYSSKVEPAYVDDPQPHLESTRQVIPVHPGFFTFQGDFLRVFHAINRRVMKFAEELGAIEQEYPAVWPIRLFKSINYFHEFPQQVILCAPVRDDFSARSEFATRYAKESDFETVAMDELFEDAEYGLEPAVCDCCYYSLEGMHGIQNAFYTCYNKVFRNERSKSGRLDRLTNFSVRDIMYVGSEHFVLEARQKLIEILGEFLTALRLKATIETANDPFFANDAAMKSVFQHSHRLKYELLAEIPHLEEEIAVGSVNLHRDFFGKAFDIKTGDGESAFSGCIGVGMERMAYALFSQHGHELEMWPSEVLAYLELGER